MFKFGFICSQIITIFYEKQILRLPKFSTKLNVNTVLTNLITLVAVHKDHSFWPKHSCFCLKKKKSLYHYNSIFIVIFSSILNFAVICTKWQNKRS